MVGYVSLVLTHFGCYEIKMLRSHGESICGNRPGPPEKAVYAPGILSPKEMVLPLTWEVQISTGTAGWKWFRAEAPEGHSQVHGYLQAGLPLHNSAPTSRSAPDPGAESPDKPTGGSY